MRKRVSHAGDAARQRMARWGVSWGVGVLILGLTGCGTPPTSATTPVTVRVAYWGGPEEMEIMEHVVAQWHEAHPDIRIYLEHTPFSTYVSRLLTRIAGNIAPDIIAVEVNLFVNFWAKEAFLPLNQFLEQDPAFELADYFPEVIDRFTVEDRLYALPRDTAPFACVYYNKRLFDEAKLPYPTDDWTWNDLLTDAQQLTQRDKGGRVTRYGFYAWAWQNFIYSNGGRLVDNVDHPTRFLLDEPAAVEGLQFYADLMNRYKVAPTPVALGNLAMGAQQLFMTERLAMFSSGIWETPLLRTIDTFDWDVVMFPRGPRGHRGFGTGGTGYAILKSTKHPEAAWEILKALAGDFGQIRLAEAGLAQPAKRSVAEGPHWAQSPQLPQNKQMLNEAIRYTIYDPFLTDWREIQDLHLLPELDLLFHGKQDAQTTVGAIMQWLDRYVAERHPDWGSDNRLIAPTGSPR